MREKLSSDQLEAMIPGGGVNKHRKKKLNAQYETVNETDDGRVLSGRQRVGNTLYMMHVRGDINDFEYRAAVKLQTHHERWTGSGLTAQMVEPVCQSGNGGDSKVISKLDAKQKWREALEYLGPYLAEVAMDAFLARSMTYKELGMKYLPGKRSVAETNGAAKGLIKAVCVLLAYHASGVQKTRMTQRVFAG